MRVSLSLVTPLFLSLSLRSFSPLSLSLVVSNSFATICICLLVSLSSLQALHFDICMKLSHTVYCKQNSRYCTSEETPLRHMAASLTPTTLDSIDRSNLISIHCLTNMDAGVLTDKNSNSCHGQLAAAVLSHFTIMQARWAHRLRAVLAQPTSKRYPSRQSRRSKYTHLLCSCVLCVLLTYCVLSILPTPHRTDSSIKNNQGARGKSYVFTAYFTYIGCTAEPVELQVKLPSGKLVAAIE